MTVDRAAASTEEAEDVHLAAGVSGVVWSARRRRQATAAMALLQTTRGMRGHGTSNWSKPERPLLRAGQLRKVAGESGEVEARASSIRGRKPLLELVDVQAAFGRGVAQS